MPEPINYTIQGTGGSLEWIDNTGGVKWSQMTQYNFVLFPNAQGAFDATISGSVLLSDSIVLQDGQTLTVTASVLSAHDFPYYDVGFGVLLNNSTLEDVLFAIRPDGIGHIGDIGPINANSFAPPSAGVTVTTGPGPQNIVLGSATYVRPNVPGGGMSTLVTAACTPGAGTYQLLFGMFVSNGEPNMQNPAALLVNLVEVT